MCSININVTYALDQIFGLHQNLKMYKTALHHCYTLTLLVIWRNVARSNLFISSQLMLFNCSEIDSEIAS